MTADAGLPVRSSPCSREVPHVSLAFLLTSLVVVVRTRLLARPRVVERVRRASAVSFPALGARPAVAER